MERNAFLPLALAFTSIASVSWAQAGDQEGEEQPGLPDGLEVPPAPVLSPEAELASFSIAPGFRVELVAAEPLVVDPVVAIFDGDGRLWVCEMRAYMPNVDGVGEDEPNGEIAILTDTDGDGRMDERRVFLDGLVLPRAVVPVEDGALVISPPDLFFARDTDGDGRADERIMIETGLGGLESPEHAINGLVFTLDNWFRCANAPVRYRRDETGTWIRSATAGGGQWGITRDDIGRVFYNTNSDPLRGDLYPSHFAIRNPNLGRADGVNVRIAHDFAVYPSRMNPGVNRGYRPETLRDDFTLASFTGGCAPLCHRGDGFPSQYSDSVFVCEPCGNLIKRYVVESGGGIELDALSAPYPAPRGPSDFMTSTDERFRPVNLFDGPDGALYVVDLYRGILQHRIYVTSFLRNQIEQRGLADPVGLGRIWRIVHAGATGRDAKRMARAPKLSTASWTELVQALAHPNGWVRDNAQRIIVEEGRGDVDAIELLRSAVGDGRRDALGRMHALAALDGIGALREEDVAARLRDTDERVLLVAVRLSESFLATGSSKLLEPVKSLALRSKAPALWHAAALALGGARTRAADEALLALAAIDTRSAESRSAVLSGLADRELAFLNELLSSDEWKENTADRPSFVAGLARCIVRGGRDDRIAELFDALAACDIPWQRRALADGVLAGRPIGPLGEPTYIRVSGAPASLDRLQRDPELAPALSALAWPGRPGLVEEEPVRPLTNDERARFDAGRALYATTCGTCHQASGLGDPGKAPPLRYSPWVLGDDETLVRILDAGLGGSITVNGQSWNAEMPAWVATDAEFAALATYLRREWGHGADPVTLETVSRVRAASARTRPWTVEALERLRPSDDKGDEKDDDEGDAQR